MAMTRKVSRPGDMGESLKLEILLEDDGDVILSIMPLGHRIPDEDNSLQFCTSGTKSHYTLLALHELYKAMLKDAQMDTRE